MAETPRYARFHAAANGKLFVVFSLSGSTPKRGSFRDNRLLQVRPRKGKAAPVPLALREPFTTFFTATERGGSRPSELLDLFGVAQDGQTLRYARVRLR
jgi:hypothetical protein